MVASDDGVKKRTGINSRPNRGRLIEWERMTLGCDTFMGVEVAGVIQSPENDERRAEKSIFHGDLGIARQFKTGNDPAADE